jgi:hypothetical protein
MNKKITRPTELNEDELDEVAGGLPISEAITKGCFPEPPDDIETETFRGHRRTLPLKPLL